MDKKYRKVKVVAFDLDGTLTQHKEKLSEENKAVLDELSKKYKLLMAGAGQARRIFEQLNRYPIDIIGNYGLQYAEYDKNTGDIVLLRDESVFKSDFLTIKTNDYKELDKVVSVLLG